MPVFRRGDVPHPPSGMSRNPDELYTIEGFFGDWVHMFRRRNPGVPKSWSHPDLIYSGIDLARAASAAPLLTGDGIRVSISRSADAGGTERNADHHQIRFYHRGSWLLETELGELEAGEGDFVVIGKSLCWRETARDDEGVVLVLETADPVSLAEPMWDSVGFASLFVDFSAMALPTPNPAMEDVETEVRVLLDGAYHTTVYDFDPCRDVTGWVGDPVVYRLNVRDVPGIGTSRGFLPPPAHAVLVSRNKSFFFNVLSPSPMPNTPRPEGSYGAPAHLNDYDEVWLNHRSDFLPHTDGHLWLLPRTLPHPGLKRPPSYPPNPVQPLREYKINFDTRARLRWTGVAGHALLEGDPRAAVYESMYGVPPERVGRLLAPPSENAQGT